jgi:hypothetical protein
MAAASSFENFERALFPALLPAEIINFYHV